MPTGVHNGPRLGRPRTPLAIRFADKFQPEPNTGCWLWTGNVLLNGYGVIRRIPTGTQAYAHRISFELHHGSIPAGKLVLHRCNVRCCVNPDHLYAGTHSDNMRDRLRENERTGRPYHGKR